MIGIYDYTVILTYANLIFGVMGIDFSGKICYTSNQQSGLARNDILWMKRI